MAKLVPPMSNGSLFRRFSEPTVPLLPAPLCAAAVSAGRDVYRVCRGGTQGCQGDPAAMTQPASMTQPGHHDPARHD